MNRVYHLNCSFSPSLTHTRRQSITATLVCYQLLSQLHLCWIEHCIISSSVALPATKNKKNHRLVLPKVIFPMRFVHVRVFVSPLHAALFGTERVCRSPCVCACMLVSETRPSISDSPICEQQPCLLIPRPESSSSLSAGTRAACARDELGGAGGGERGGRLLSSSGDKSFFTPTPNFHTFLSSHAVYSSLSSHPFLLSIFPRPSPLSHSDLIHSSFQSNHLPCPPLLILSPIPHLFTPFAIFLSQTSYTFSFLCRCLGIFPKQSFPLPQPFSFPRSPLSHSPPSQVVSFIWSKHRSKPTPLFPSICFTSFSGPWLSSHIIITFSRATFCLSVSIGGQGTAGVELMGWNSALWWIFILLPLAAIPSRRVAEASSPQMPPSICHRRDGTHRKVSGAKAEEGATEGAPPTQKEPNSYIWATSNKC